MSLIRLRKQQNNPEGNRQQQLPRRKQQKQQSQQLSPCSCLFALLVFILGFVIGNLNVDCTAETEEPKFRRTDFACPSCRCKKGISSMSLLTLHDEERLDNPSNKAQQNKTNITQVEGDAKSPNYHLIFSTGCNSFQRWQAHLLFYSAMKVRQPGHITRIVSGCPDPREQRQAQYWFDNFIAGMSPRFHMHIMTDSVADMVNSDANTGGGGGGGGGNTSIVDTYYYFNKPYGVRDWMTKTFKMTDQTKDEVEDADRDIIMLIDPDMILLKPLVPPGVGHRPTMRTGQPIAQRYAYEDRWRTSLLNISTIVGPASPAITKYNATEAKEFFPAGPPYMATRRDMDKVHAHLPGELLGEMYAYSLAAAHLELPHLLLNDLMMSAPHIEREGWSAVDAVMNDYRDVPQGQMCDLAASITPSKSLPPVLHYCQPYHVGPDWYFHKLDLPHAFLDDCQLQELLKEEEPPYLLDAMTVGTKKLNGTRQRLLTPEYVRRNAFMLCTITRYINNAAAFVRERRCPSL